MQLTYAFNITLQYCRNIIIAESVANEINLKYFIEKNVIKIVNQEIKKLPQSFAVVYIGEHAGNFLSLLIKYYCMIDQLTMYRRRPPIQDNQ